MNAKFYIVTRLNAPCFPGRERLEANNLDYKWLVSRLYLLQKFCQRSVMNQGWKNFEWILWCHPETTAWFRNKISCFPATVLYADCVSEAIDWDADIIVTTRLDSDDLIHRDFMANVHGHLEAFTASSLKRQVYAFRHGYRYRSNAGPRGTLNHATQDNAPFLTLFADIRNDKEDAIVFHERHTRMLDLHGHVINKDLAAWISVVHDDQIATTAVGIRALADITKTFKEFGVKK